MKKVLILLLVLSLALPVSAAGNLVFDGEQLLTDTQIRQLETRYAEYSQSYGFTPALVTTESFDGLTAEDYAGDYYDAHGLPYDGILLLVSLTEGQWYILTNGACYERISDANANSIGGELVPMLQSGDYYEAFALFPELAQKAFGDSSISDYGGVDVPAARKNYGKTIAISMGVGILIGLITVGVMASQMKSVKPSSNASDYVRPGSMQLTNQRDIFLYSHVSRTPRPKSNSSGGGHGGGGSRGGSGGRL